MNKIQKVRNFFATCPLLDDFLGQHIDWTDSTPRNYGIMPTGESVIRIEEDICGTRTLYKQSNYAIYANFLTVDDVVRLEAAGFVESLIEWVEAQSESRTIPILGDSPDEERMTAQNGMLYRLSENGTTGLYQIQIACFYKKRYERNEF